LSKVEWILNHLKEKEIKINIRKDMIGNLNWIDGSIYLEKSIHRIRWMPETLIENIAYLNSCTIKLQQCKREFSIDTLFSNFLFLLDSHCELILILIDWTTTGISFYLANFFIQSTDPPCNSVN